MLQHRGCIDKVGDGIADVSDAFTNVLVTSHPNCTVVLQHVGDSFYHCRFHQHIGNCIANVFDCHCATEKGGKLEHQSHPNRAENCLIPLFSNRAPIAQAVEHV